MYSHLHEYLLPTPIISLGPICRRALRDAVRATYVFLELVSLVLSVVLRVPILAFTVHLITWVSMRFFLLVSLV
jgi:hypothetical protein